MTTAMATMTLTMSMNGQINRKKREQRMQRVAKSNKEAEQQQRQTAEKEATREEVNATCRHRHHGRSAAGNYHKQQQFPYMYECGLRVSVTAEKK